MKQLFIFIALIATTFVGAQTISPPVTTEFCPNQEYSFTVSLPSAYQSRIDVDGGATVTALPDTGTVKIIFKGKFSDNNRVQVFKVFYGSTSKDFKFTKVKSLFSEYKNGKDNPEKITVPFCQTTPVTLTLTGQYVEAATNPAVGFGAITKFEYVIPAGWYLNSSLSTGNNLITATSSTVTLTPNANTGGVIKYRALADCPDAISGTLFNYISIERTYPTYSLSPQTLSVVCGTSKTQIFKVDASFSSSCTVSYLWNLGENNKWFYLGSPAPASFTTPSNTITLSSSTAGGPPATVYVTPIVNGFPQTILNCTTSLTPFTSPATISGVSSICTLQSLSYFTINAGANNTVAWSTSNTAFATVITQTNSQATVKAITQGLFYTKAIITNQCGQTVPKTSEPITIGTPMPLIDGFYCYSESAPCGLNVPANNNYLEFSLSAPTGNYVPLESDWQWEKISGNFYFLNNGQYTGTSATGRQCNIYLTGANPTDNPLQLRCKVRNQCGWGNWRYYTWNDGTTTVVPPPPPPAKYYKVYPNPSGGYAANISLLDPAIIPPTSGPVVIKLYTIYGQLLSTTNMTTNSSGTVYIYSYPYNTMYIIISFGTHTESHTVVKY